MSLLFSSHLLPDVEAVCDYVVVLGSGKVLTQGKIQELKQVHHRCFEVRLKADPAAFVDRLSALGCETEARDDLLLVQLPDLLRRSCSGKWPRNSGNKFAICGHSAARWKKFS